METKQLYTGPCRWCLTIQTNCVNKSLYSLYFNEDPSYGIDKDTPALDKQGRFLWCSNLKNIGNLRKYMIKLYAQHKIKNYPITYVNIAKALHGLDHDHNNPELWDETIGLINIIKDYMQFLSGDVENEKRIHLLGALSVHLFEGKDLPPFYKRYKTSKQRIIEHILFCLYSIYQNSRIL